MSETPEAATPVAARSACANCGAELHGPYCHRCGQGARSPLMPARAALTEIAREVFDLDNRAVRTLKALMLRPGFLTLEYVAGRRRRWTSPLRLYLLGALVYFLVAKWTQPSSFLFITGTDQTEEMLTWLPRALAVLVPVFALIDHGLFSRGGRLWAENLVLALHVHAGWFVLSIVGAFQGFLPDPGDSWRWYHFALAVPVGLSQFAILIYLWRSLRVVHGRGRWATAWRMLVLILLHSLGIAAVLAIVLGLFTVVSTSP